MSNGAQVIVGDVAWDGGCVEIRFGRQAYPLTALEYAHKINREKVRRIGSQRIDALTPGEYDVDQVKATMEAAVYAKFRNDLAAGAGTGGFASQRFSIHVDQFHPDIGNDNDKLSQCSWAGASKKIEGGSKANLVECMFDCRQVIENGATPNRVRGPIKGGIANI
jgi:hypothetical protein